MTDARAQQFRALTCSSLSRWQTLRLVVLARSAPELAGVLTEEIGGSNAGSGHEALIEAVDEPMSDEMFVTHSRRRRWTPGPRG